MYKQIDIEGALRFGWETTINNIGLLMKAFLIGLILPTIPDILSEQCADSMPIIASFLRMISFASSILLGVGYMRILLMLHDGQAACVRTLFSGKELFLYYFAGLILYALIVLGGFFLVNYPWNYFGT